MPGKSIQIIDSYDEDWAYSDSVSGNIGQNPDYSLQKFASGPTRYCTDCGDEKPITEFHKNGDRHRSQCKSCRSKHRGGGARYGDITREDIIDRVADKLIARMAL